MRLLLDTHVFLWMQVTPERLGRSLALVEDTANELILSAASSWEIALKWALGKLALPDPPDVYVPRRVQSSGVTTLPVEHSHALAVARLPMHHSDPFDRLLVAQARVERLRLVTVDPAFATYDVDVVQVERKGSHDR